VGPGRRGEGDADGAASRWPDLNSAIQFHASSNHRIVNAFCIVAVVGVEAAPRRPPLSCVMQAISESPDPACRDVCAAVGVRGPPRLWICGCGVWAARPRAEGSRVRETIRLWFSLDFCACQLCVLVCGITTTPTFEVHVRASPASRGKENVALALQLYKALQLQVLVQQADPLAARVVAFVLGDARVDQQLDVLHCVRVYRIIAIFRLVGGHRAP